MTHQQQRSAMRNRYLIGAGAALALALSGGSARAQLFAMPSGPGEWYFGGEGGWTDLESPQSGPVTGVGPNQLTHFAIKFDDGFNAGGRVGYEWGPWRLEEEFRYTKNDATSELSTPAAAAFRNASGARYTYALMTNAIYDFNIGMPFTPHIGAGIGAVIQHDSWNALPPPLVPSGLCANSTDVTFGYQAIAGIRYNLNSYMVFDLDYRYLATTDPVFKFGGGAAQEAGFIGESYRSGYATHSLLASLTVKFGAPPPPPVAAAPAPPAPPPIVRKVFLVFFDWDRAAVTPEGMQIIQQAAAAWHAGAPITIQITGYTDRSGSPGYNQRLSERRANSVAVALEHFGVPRTDMAVSGRGENDNRVPTANGVREPQNRRVEIVFS
jgi:OmpA-OmpF porin, OOP family